MLHRLLLPALLLALAACNHKSTDSPRIDFGPGTGFSYRDGSNIPAGAQDPTDWASDATWQSPETALFPDIKFNLNAAQPAGFVEFAYLYPNPSRASTWGFTSKETAPNIRPDFTVTAVLVGADYQVIQRIAPNSSNKGNFAISFDYSQLSLQPGSLYRIYYVLYDANGLLYKGHGDFLYKQ
jgi:hypothetical protein